MTLLVIHIKVLLLNVSLLMNNSGKMPSERLARITFPTFFLSQLVIKGMKLSAGHPLE